MIHFMLDGVLKTFDQKSQLEIHQPGVSLHLSYASLQCLHGPERGHCTNRHLSRQVVCLAEAPDVLLLPVFGKNRGKFTGLADLRSLPVEDVDGHDNQT
jgi:hypothetical protein